MGGNVKALFRRGRARLRLGDIDGAKADLSKAAHAAPQDRAVRDELEAAKHWVPPPPAPPPAPPGPLAKFNGAIAAAWRLVVEAAPGMWRQIVFVSLAAALL